MGRKRKNNIEQEMLPKIEEEEEKVDSVPELSTQEMEEHDRVDREYFDTMPPGYRFTPTGEELIANYLNKKMSDLSSLPINRIRDINIYDYHPQNLTSVYKLHRGKEWYFFTPRYRKYPNGQRPDRVAGNGYWKASGPDFPICNDQGIKIGTKKILVYYEGKAKEYNGVRTDWVMHEYINQVDNTKNVGPADKKDAKDMKLDEWVLCMIYNKSYKEGEAIDNQQDGNNNMIVPANSNQLPPDQNPNGHSFLRHNVQLEPNPTTNQGQDGAGFFNRDNLFVPNQNIRQRLDGGSSYNRALMPRQNVQVPNPNIAQRQDGTRFYNMPSNLPRQNVQVANPNITHGLDGVRFDSRPNLPFHNVQVSNSNTNQFPYGASFDNMGSLPMQNMIRMPTQNVQVPHPNIRQGPDGKRFNNMGHNLPTQNVQVPNLNITHGLNGLPFYNRPRLPLHNVQELNSNINQFPYGGGFSNMGSLPMQNMVRMPMQNVQVPNPNIRQGPDGKRFNNMGNNLPTQTVQVPNPNIIQGQDGRSYYNMASNLPRQNVQVPNLNITHGLNGLPFHNRPRLPLHNVQELNSNRNQFPYGGGFNNMDSLPMHNDEKNLYNMVNFPPSHYDQQQNLYGRNRPHVQSLGNNNANNQQVITPDPLEIVQAQYQTRSFPPQFINPDPFEDESYDSHLLQEALQGEEQFGSLNSAQGYPAVVDYKDEVPLDSKDGELGGADQASLSSKE